MQCTFDLKPLFASDIIKVHDDLLPVGFRGDAGECLSAKNKIATIVNSMGNLSAVAQNLRTSVTSSQRMCGKQCIYLLSSQGNAYGNGKDKTVVSGLLKMGPKDLYLYDEGGKFRCSHNTPSILDFYVHESQQRRGIGKRLIDNMLNDLGLTLPQCALDRPSTKMIAFLAKNYRLTSPIAQANNYAVFKGFFADEGKERKSQPQLKPQSNRLLQPLQSVQSVLSMAEILETANGRDKNTKF